MAFFFNILSIFDYLGLIKTDLSSNIEYVNQPPSLGIFSKLLAPKIQIEKKEELFPFIRKESKKKLRKKFLLGTNRRGQDIFSLLIEGSKVFAIPGLIAIGTAIFLGLFSGIFTAFYDNFISKVILQVVNLIHSLPRLLVLLIIGIVSNFNIDVLMLTLGIINFPKVANSVSSKIKMLIQQQFIEAAIEADIPKFKIIFKHILWTNCRHIVLIESAFGMADAIFTETTLSYLGFGSNTASWGRMIYEGAEFITSGYYWMSVLPALGVIITILGYYIIADSINNITRLKMGYV